MVKTTWALAALAALAGGAAAAEGALGAAARLNAARADALQRQFAEDRQELEAGSFWKTLSPAQRRARLGVLRSLYASRRRALREAARDEQRSLRLTPAPTKRSPPRGESWWERRGGFRVRAMTPRQSP